MVTPSSKIDVLVVGAGVSGLTSAICLAEAELAVRVLAQKPPAETTSAVAGASWGPYPSEDPRVARWCRTTLEALEALAVGPEVCGVRLVPGMEASATPLDPPEWARNLPSFRTTRPDELPPGFASGWSFRSPLVDMPTYLRYLERRLARAGTRVEIASVNSLVDVVSSSYVLVNCTGLAARELLGDEELSPTRGQLVVVKNPGLDHFFQDNVEIGDMTYFLPHADHVVLGGSAIPGAKHLEVDPGITEAIIERCARVEPLLRDPIVVGHRVGLRPARGRVRLERDEINGCPVVHNYGHGGSGVTLSWGCAQEVLTHVRALIVDKGQTALGRRDRCG